MEKRFLQICDYYITKKPIMLSTLLGSCVGVCLYNKTNGHAAMNHFLMPSANPIEMEQEVGKYGKSSCELIIKTLMKDDLNPLHYTAQVFGGANMFNLGDSVGDIGNRNIDTAEQVLKKYGIRIIRREIGGSEGRKIDFNTTSNKVECLKLGGKRNIESLKIQNEKAFKKIEEIYMRFSKS